MSKRKILIVDDSAVMRKGIIELIKGITDAEFTEAVDGEDGLQKYKDIKPDLVTMDINMPNMNGIASLKAIIDFDVGAKVIMLTTETDKSKIIEAVSLGAKSYIIKPIDKAKSLQKIKTVIDL